MTPISSMLNLGPKCQKWLGDVGIHTREDLEKVGAVGAYKLVEQHGVKNMNILFLYAMWGALFECPWNEVPEDIKKQLQEELNEG